jgi:hypothetical protein
MMPRPTDEPGWTVLCGEDAKLEWGVKQEGDQFINIFGGWKNINHPGAPFKPGVWYRRRSAHTELNHFI